MKINIEAQLLCCHNLTTGIPFYSYNLIKSLLKRKSENTYSVSFFDYGKERGNREFINRRLPKDAIDIYECNDVNYKNIMNACVTNDFSPFPKNYRDYFKLTADIIHFPTSTAFSYKNTEKFVVTIHDIMPIIFINRKYWSDDFTKAFINCQNYIAENNNITIIADSQCTKNDISRYLDVDSSRIFVTPLGYDEDNLFHDENHEVLQELNINSPFILYLGLLNIRKGIPDILSAFASIKKKYKGLKLVLAGKSRKDFESWYDKANETSFDDVIFTDYVTDEQKRVLLSSAEVFLFPSEYEGFGLPVLEAMACGSPVITTNISSLPEVGGDAVMYVSPNQPEELAEAITKFLDSKTLREEYIRKGYERTKLFSWDKTAALTEEVYKIHYQRTH